MGTGREAGRGAFSERAWAKAFQHLSATPAGDLDAADLERLAVAAYLIGRDDESAAAWEAAHRRHVDTGDSAEAARCAFWLAFCLMMRGQHAQAGGWLGRAEALIAPGDPDCAAAGYVLIPKLLGALGGGDPATARDLAVRGREIGEQFGDADLRAFGTLGHGQALIALGETTAGTARLDEVMLHVTSGEVGPITSGIVYCAVILECMGLFDLSRAAEWTGALTRWCDAQPDLVPYRGQCQVHRSQLQQAAGDWPDAITTAEAACRHLTDPPHPALGLAYYQVAEMHRLVGALDEAEAEYRRAVRHGHQAMPGLALLELARGDVSSAVASISRVLIESQTPSERPALLAAAVDIFRAAGDVGRVREAADELAKRADGSASVALQSMAAQAIGTALLSEGDAAAALASLRAASAGWQQARMPYQRARVAVLLGLSCAALGDRASAALELEAAGDAFEALGAVPDRVQARSLAARLATPSGAKGPAGALSARECEVLVHVAAGRTNRHIAEAMHISQHTVSRHLENIFTKLEVTTRAAATARAYELGLL